MYFFFLGRVLEDKEYFEQTTKRIIDTRERMKRKFAKLGFDMTDSLTNFLFVSHKKVPANKIYEAARKEGIFVRYWNKPRINNYLRITVGTDEEMDTLVRFLTDYLSNEAE